MTTIPLKTYPFSFQPGALEAAPQLIGLLRVAPPGGYTTQEVELVTSVLVAIELARRGQSGSVELSAEQLGFLRGRVAEQRFEIADPAIADFLNDILLDKTSDNPENLSDNTQEPQVELPPQREE